MNLMVLHTTPDGQITYEGLPVVNQAEVKRWLWYKQTGGYGAPYHQWETLTNHDYELPDEEFEVLYLITDGINEVIKILRKPVSEEGEKSKVSGEAAKITTKEFSVQRLKNGLGHSHLVIVVEEAIPDIAIGTILIVPYAEGFKDPIRVKVLLDENQALKTANVKFAVVAEYIFD